MNVQRIYANISIGTNIRGPWILDSEFSDVKCSDFIREDGKTKIRFEDNYLLYLCLKSTSLLRNLPVSFASHSRRHLPHAGTSDYWNNVTKDKAGPPFLTLLLREKLGLRISAYVLSVTSNSMLRLWQLLPVRDPSPDCASHANHCLIIP